MFESKTVAQAIAPFKKVVTNLKQVIEAQDSAIRTKTADVERVTTEAAEFAARENTYIDAARTERQKAKRLMDKLANLLEDDDEETPTTDANAVITIVDADRPE